MRRRAGKSRSFGACVACLILAAGCRGGAEAKLPADGGVGRGPRLLRIDPQTAQKLGVRVEAAGSQAGEHRLRLPGSLDFDIERVARVGSVLEGRVVSVMSKVGDRVKKGQRMATLMAPAVATAQAEYLASRAEVAFAGDRVSREEALATRELTTAQELARARSEKAKAEASTSAAEARLRALRVAVPDGKQSLAESGLIALVAPLDGVVVERSVLLGQYLFPDDTAFVVADLSTLWANVDLFEADVPYLRTGSDVELALDAYPGKVFHGQLSSIEPRLSKTSRSLRARVSVPNPDGALRPGYFVRASIAIPNGSDEILVPSGAVQPLDEDVVFVLRDATLGVYEVRPVLVSRRTAEMAEISEGLSRGESIVVQGAFLLRGEVARQ
jgi:cobalt-zinc-cadmium efflux system membrane fusion protein